MREGLPDVDRGVAVFVLHCVIPVHGGKRPVRPGGGHTDFLVWGGREGGREGRRDGERSMGERKGRNEIARATAPQSSTGLSVNCLRRK